MEIPNGATHYRIVDKLFPFPQEISYFKQSPFSLWFEDNKEWREIPRGMQNYYLHGIKTIGNTKDGATHTYSNPNNKWEALIKNNGDDWFVLLGGNWEPLSKEFNDYIIEKAEPMESREIINHPTHYTQGKVECIDAIESATIGKNGFEAYCLGNVIKYLWRYEEKGGKESVEKAQWYLNKLLEQMK